MLTSTTVVLMPTPESPSVTTASAARSPIEYARVTVYCVPSSPETGSKKASRTTIAPPRVGISARASSIYKFSMFEVGAVLPGA